MTTVQIQEHWEEAAELNEEEKAGTECKLLSVCVIELRGVASPPGTYTPLDYGSAHPGKMSMPKRRVDVSQGNLPTLYRVMGNLDRDPSQDKAHILAIYEINGE